MAITGKCRLPGLPKPYNKPDKPYSPEELTDLEKRWRYTYGKMRNAAMGNGRAMDYAAAQSDWMLKVGEANALKPRNLGRAADFWAKNFAIEYDDFMQRNLSDTGDVHQRVRRMKTFVSARLGDMMAQAETIKALGDAQKNAQKVMRKLPKEMSDELWEDARELTQLPRILAASGDAPTVAYRMAPYEKNLVEKGVSMGLDESQVREVISQAAIVTSAYDEALAIAKGTGIPGATSATDYYRRALTPDVEQIVKRRGELRGDRVKDAKELYKSFQESTSRMDFTVGDEHLLAYALGKPIGSISDMVKDGKQLTQALLDLPPNKLDSLVKMGIVNKVPLTNAELVRQIAKGYELPVKGLSDIFITDEAQAFQLYTRHLKDMVAKSTILQGVFKEGMEKGWAITEGMKAADPAKYAGFVPIDYRTLGKYITLERRKDLKSVGGFYVHPVVKENLVGVLDLATSPGKMGMVAELLHHVSFVMMNSKKLALATPKYILVNALGGIISSFIGGGNLLTALPNFLQYTRILKGGTGGLDNSVKRFAGGTLTEAELYKQLRESGGLNDFIPQAALESYHTPKGAWNPANVGKAINYAYYTAKRFGALDGVKKVEDLVSNMVSEPVMHLGFAANVLDNAYKWNLYKTILSDNPLAQAGGFLTTGTLHKFGTIAEAQKHVDRYFFDYSNMGAFDKEVSNFGLPFWMWMSRNLPSQMRHMVNQPQQYLAWQRLRAMFNDPVEQEGDALPTGAVPKYVRDTLPLYYKDGDGFYAVHMTAFDPISDGLIQMERLSTDLGRLITGGYTGTDEQQRRQAGGEYRSDFLFDNLGSVYGFYKSALQGLQWLSGAEKDFITGKSLKDDPSNPTSYLGANMPPLARLFLEQNVPITSTINAVNPGNKFGTSLQYDEQGNITRLPQRSFLGANRSDRDTKSPGLQALRPFIGATVTKFDPYTRALNMGYTENDMRSLDANLYRRVKKINENYPLMDEKAKANAQTEMESIKNVLFTLRLDLARVKAWRVKYNALPDKEARKRAINNLTPEQRSQIKIADEDARQVTRVTERFDTFDLMVQEEQRRGK